jgi:hypothetical protein
MEEQHIRIKAILEVVGKPKDYIEQKLAEYIEKIKEDEHLMIMEQKISPAEEDNAIWTTFAEVEVIIKGIENLVGFCIDYMPSSIDIIKPEHFNMNQREFNNFANDMLAKLHKVDMVTKQLGTENSFLKQNMNRLLSNSLLVMVRVGINKLHKIANATGIGEEEAKLMLNQLIKNNRIKEEDGIYSIQ